MKNLELKNELKNKHELLSRHPMYSQINTVEDLQIYMESHVFAVWDFMSLLKSLQKSITCVEVPWVPSRYPKHLVRMINEIVLGEESDVDQNGNASDHFSLYLESMKEVGANTELINRFLKEFSFGEISPAIRKFVSFNLQLAMSDELHKIASSFFYGREKLIPDMFTGLLKDLDHSKLNCPTFIYYIERHIELDGDEHSELASECLDIICDNNEDLEKEALETGIIALDLRIALWDEVLEKLKYNGEVIIN